MKTLILTSSILCFFLLSLLSSFAQHIFIEPIPSWVHPIPADVTWENKDQQISGSVYYLLNDYQTHIPLEAVYHKQAKKILNIEGVQEESDLSIYFDPNYQHLLIHEVSVFRNGTVINKLKDHTFRTIQREAGQERYLYDGTVEAVLNLQDIRSGDVITYSFTKVGFNPAYQGHRASTVDLEYGLPIKDLYERIISSKGRVPVFKYFNDAPKPKIRELGDGTEYIWAKSNVEGFLPDTRIPSWYRAYEEIHYSDYKDWQEVVEDILSLFAIESQELARLREEFSTLIPTKDSTELLNQVVRFVQDEVRYLGFEEGIHAFKPHAPSQVLQQRFGDCKDKSFLLCTLLRSYGFEAYPVLVHSRIKANVTDRLPSLTAFNHCIAQIQLDTGVIYIDPTINNQGGAVDKIAFPDYRYGLVVREGETNLRELPKSIEKGTEVVQELIVQNETDSILFTVQSTFHQSEADRMRSFFANSSRKEISREYLTYYGKEYPGIRLAAPLEFQDFRDSMNIFLVKEAYWIAPIGPPSEDKQDLTEFSIYAIDLHSLLSVPQDLNRSMPFAISASHPYRLHIRLTFPYAPTGFVGTKTIKKDAYRYEYSSRIEDNSILIQHAYQTLTDHIPSEQIETYFRDHEQIKDYLGYDATYGPKAKLPFVISWMMLLLANGLCLFALFLCWKLYHAYDVPPKYAMRRDRPIGGFLWIIPALLLVKAGYSLYFLFDKGKYLNANAWEFLQTNSGIPSADVTRVLLSLDMVYDMFQLVFIGFLLLIFFKKRTIFPPLMIKYIWINLMYSVVMGYLMSTKSIILGITPPFMLYALTLFFSFFCVIYLKQSVQVEQTFIHSLKTS
ncbi:MAG: DUF3857 domain-containing protein [Bacteroidota bacterium]